MHVTLPDRVGYFGRFGGRFVPETLMHALDELQTAYTNAVADPSFHAELDRLLGEFVGRPTPLYLAHGLTSHAGGARIYLKREDLNHTGAHKINNALGQVLLAQRLGKTRILAETGAGQHGVATATAAALAGLECVVYMGAEDVRRQRANVRRMRLLGARVRSVESGACTLKDAINEAIRDWVTNVDGTHYAIGSVVGPHPYPEMVRDFQSVIGREARRQVLEREGKLPDAVVACVGGGSNAIGIFHPFLADTGVRLVGVEAAGCASLGGGSVGSLHGALSYLLQDSHGQVAPTHSISAGLDYPGVGPEHAHLHESGRVDYRTAGDEEALAALRLLCRAEGILPALESSHAVARALEVAQAIGPDGVVIVNLSGRGDKDLDLVEEAS